MKNQKSLSFIDDYYALYLLVELADLKRGKIREGMRKRLCQHLKHVWEEEN
jgi:hypothetical protein